MLFFNNNISLKSFIYFKFYVIHKFINNYTIYKIYDSSALYGMTNHQNLYMYKRKKWSTIKDLISDDCTRNTFFCM